MTKHEQATAQYGDSGYARMTSKNGQRRRFCLRQNDERILAPVAGVPDVATTFGAPLAFNPNGSAMGRTLVFSWNPDVAASVPAVVAGDPYIVAVNGWRSWDNFDGTRRRWADADHDLRVGRADGEKNCAGCGEELFLHGFGRSLELLPVKMRIAVESCVGYFAGGDPVGVRHRHRMSDDGSTMQMNGV